MSESIIFRILSDPLAITLAIFFFGASIFVHEWGHYLAARWRGLKIERFSIGFGPRLFGWKDKRGVDWRISLFPLGGYVALPQLADLRGIEGEPESESDALKPISYADKMYVAVAGAVFNVFFALFLASILWIIGIPAIKAQNSNIVGYVSQTMADQNGIEREGPAALAGLQPGDQILEIDGKAIEDWEDILYAVTTGTGRSERGNPKSTVEIQREGEQQTITLFPLLDAEEGIRRIGIAPAVPLLVGNTMPKSPAELGGIQAGDRIVGVNGQPVFHRIQLSELIQNQPDRALDLKVLRGDQSTNLTIFPEKVEVNTAGDTVPMIGVRWKNETITEHPSPFAQLSDAITMTFRVLYALFHPHSNIGISNLSGPVGIGYTLSVISQIGILEVLSVVVLININLAILNLLPIPVLDGGHMAFATVAKVRGKPIPAKIIASAQGAFMLMFLMIFLYVTFFDVNRVKRRESDAIEAERVQSERIPIEFSGQSLPESKAEETPQP